MRLLLLLLPLLALPASAAVVKHYFHVQSGTGFFVNEEGWLLTNEHVVHGCSRVTLKGPEYPETEAEVHSTDPQHDLALIHAPARPKDTALLRENIEGLQPGDGVVVIGYPGDAWKTGIYKLSEATMVNTHGPKDHPDWIEFSDSVAHGNSGGPLIDRSGNVIGIVTAMMSTERQLFEVNRQTGEKKLLETTNTKSDGAIGLATAEGFMHQNAVEFRVSLSGAETGTYGIERAVSGYIVNVQCRKPVSAAEGAADAASESETQETPAQ